jgi:hypothetical protein
MSPPNCLHLDPICHPIPPNRTPLSFPPPQTVTVNWLLSQMGGTAIAFCCRWPPRLPSHHCRTIPAVQSRHRRHHQHRCHHPPPCNCHCIFIVLRLSLRIASCLPSCPSSASSPTAGCCIASPDATASNLPSASASHGTVTSRHAPLVPLVQLIVASPLLTPPPLIIPVVISAVVTVIGGGRESSPSSQLSASSSSSFVIIIQLIVTFAGPSSPVLLLSPSRQLPWAFPSLSPSPVVQRRCQRRSQHPLLLYCPRCYRRHHLVSRICVHLRSIGGKGSNQGTAVSIMMYG